MGAVRRCGRCVRTGRDAPERWPTRIASKPCSQPRRCASPASRCRRSRRHASRRRRRSPSKISSRDRRKRSISPCRAAGRRTRSRGHRRARSRRGVARRARTGCSRGWRASSPSPISRCRIADGAGAPPADAATASSAAPTAARFPCPRRGRGQRCPGARAGARAGAARRQDAARSPRRVRRCAMRISRAGSAKRASPFVRGAAWRWSDAPGRGVRGRGRSLAGRFCAGDPARGRGARATVRAGARARRCRAGAARRRDGRRMGRATKSTAGARRGEWTRACRRAQASLPKRRRRRRWRRRRSRSVTPSCDMRTACLAPDDALPLLARAAPALRALPAGSREKRDVRRRSLDARSRACRCRRRSRSSMRD